MISLIDFDKYWHQMPTKVPALKKVFLVSDESELRDFVKDISPADQPFAMVLIPSANSRGSEPDNFGENNQTLFYILEREDKTEHTTLQLQMRTQPVCEAVKDQLLNDKTSCSLLWNLREDSFETDPESKISSLCSGWSVSFQF